MLLWYDGAVKLAPRVCTTQTHRNNKPTQNQRMIALPLHDELIVDLKERFYQKTCVLPTSHH